MNDRPSNGVEAGWGSRYVRITGRDFLVIVILALALGWMVWSIREQHVAIGRAIETRCNPGAPLLF